MSLDERKAAILKALIEDYIETAEPVGSRTIAKKISIGLSSATIRNEMSDLEDMGYIGKPHTSAGRIPSSLGYRMYVDSLIKEIHTTSMELEFIKKKMEANLSELNRFLDFSARTISDETGLTAITKTPNLTLGAISRFEIVKVHEHYLMFILVTNTGIIKNKQVRILAPVSENSIQYIKTILNEELSGHTMAQITPNKIERLKARFNNNIELLGVILEFITETMESSNNSEYYLTGKSSTLKAPEFTSMEKVLGFLDFIESKDQVNSLISSITDKSGITVIIGDESPLLKNNDLSLVISTYKAFGNMTGAIGVIGPKRMNYGKVISTLETVSKMMTDILGNEE